MNCWELRQELNMYVFKLELVGVFPNMLFYLSFFTKYYPLAKFQIYIHSLSIKIDPYRPVHFKKLNKNYLNFFKHFFVVPQKVL